MMDEHGGPSVASILRSFVCRSVGRSAGQAGLERGKRPSRAQSRLVATKAHVILRRYVVLIWMRDNTEF